jgi:LacI family transcriptional regulator
MKKISLKDIASKLGVAPSTVSFVLNGKAKEMRISKGLAKKILEVADKFGYHPNRIAVSLRTGTSKILGLMVEDISNNFFAMLARTIEIEAEKFGYNVVFCSTENDSKKGQQLLRILSEQQVDGFLIAPTAGMRDDIRLLHDHNHAIVLMDRNFPGLPVTSVMADNYQGVKLAMEHLLTEGYRKIAFVTVDLDFINMKRRELAYVSMLKKNTKKNNPDLILKLPANSVQNNTVRLIESFLRINQPDAVLFATNYLGIAGLESIRNLKITIPSELAVICFDDHDVFRLHSPAITTIAQPVKEIAVNAVKLLIEKIAGVKKTSSAKSVQLATILVERHST